MVFPPVQSGRLTRALALAGSIALLGACSDSNNDVLNVGGGDGSGANPQTFSADIVWTEYGIPHIRAAAGDWASAGYGVGYAYARENYCTMMREYVISAGESARYLGDDGDINRDIVVKLYNSESAVERMIGQLSEQLASSLRGYAAGFNRYLNETGVDNLAQGEEGCRGEPWVREITVNDVVRAIHRSVLGGSAMPLADFIAAPQGPQVAMAKAVMPAAVFAQRLHAELDRDTFVAGLDMPEGKDIGSNAYAVGAENAQNGSGILLGNPHFPWQGHQRFFMFHVTVEGEYDVMGAALGGLPAPVIGFNKDLAWSHTVSTGQRFTFYELTLNPDNPMQYEYDGEMRDITPETVTVERINDDGEVEAVEHTLYLTHYGPVVDLGSIASALGGWPNASGTILAYRDGNLENIRGLQQWTNMGMAQDLDEFKTALRDLGIPWVNTIAADRYGDAFYGDISVVPNVTAAQYSSCVRGPVQQLVTSFGRLMMDGSDSGCEWNIEEGAPEGLFGYDSLPKLETRGYAANANDSYWLSHPDNLLVGFSPVIGRENVEQSRRTRATFSQAEKRVNGTDGLGTAGFNIDNIRELLYSADNYTAHLVADGVDTVCNALPAEPTGEALQARQACDVLLAWDRSHKVDSVGTQVFVEFWRVLRGVSNLWETPFDPADPVNTPRDLNVSDAAVAAAVQGALATAVQVLDAAEIPLDRPWGEVQFDEKNGVRYPIHGGSSDMMFSVITSDLVPGEGYSAIRHGNSYMQAVTWDESDCPNAYAILSYSQSTDPASAHHADLTQLYGEGGWIDMPFCEADRDAQEIERMTISE